MVGVWDSTAFAVNAGKAGGNHVVRQQVIPAAVQFLSHRDGWLPPLYPPEAGALPLTTKRGEAMQTLPDEVDVLLQLLILLQHPCYLQVRVHCGRVVTFTYFCPD